MTMRIETVVYKQEQAAKQCVKGLHRSPPWMLASATRSSVKTTGGNHIDIRLPPKRSEYPQFHNQGRSPWLLLVASPLNIMAILRPSPYVGSSDSRAGTIACANPRQGGQTRVDRPRAAGAGEMVPSTPKTSRFWRHGAPACRADRNSVAVGGAPIWPPSQPAGWQAGQERRVEGPRGNGHYANPDFAVATPDGLARASQNLRPVIARPIAVSAIDASCGPRNSLTSQRSIIGHEACARGRGVECLIHLSAAPAPAGRPPPTGARSLRDVSRTGGAHAGRPGPAAFR